MQGSIMRLLRGILGVLTIAHIAAVGSRAKVGYSWVWLLRATLNPNP